MVEILKIAYGWSWKLRGGNFIRKCGEVGEYK
jgi:hypothetical protein